MQHNEKWGYLRETSVAAQKAGVDKETGLHRTGLDEYLKVIFSNTEDWVHDNVIPNSNLRIRPDYRSDSLKLIIEFDGIQHYQKPDVILRDSENVKKYETLGYKVVRIPYFIQLTNGAVKKLFGVEVKEKLFNESFPSLGKTSGPGYLCYQGLLRMAREFKEFQTQYEVNVKYLKSLNDEYATGVSLLENAFNQL